MTNERYQHLMSADECKLTEEELAEGWHYCAEWDYLLVGPGMGELVVCKCWNPEHPVYKTIPPQEERVIGDIDL